MVHSGKARSSDVPEGAWLPLVGDWLTACSPVEAGVRRSSETFDEAGVC